MFANFHTHTTYSDGKNTPEEVIEKALELGMEAIGFSDHSCTPFDMNYCMTEKGTREYIKHINSLKKKYQGKIQVYLGVEQDYFSGRASDDFDYVIGSCHYVYHAGEYYPIDHREYMVAALIEMGYGNDPYAYLQDYYKQMGNMVKQTGATIIGHFDVSTKYNQDGHLFDENSEQYKTIVKRAMDELLLSPITFEMNTGAISRGFLKRPYPDSWERKYISSRGGKTIFGSDSHAIETLASGYDLYSSFLKDERLIEASIKDIMKNK